MYCTLYKIDLWLQRMKATSTHQVKTSLWNFQIHAIKYASERVRNFVELERLRIKKQNKC